MIGFEVAFSTLGAASVGWALAMIFDTKAPRRFECYTAGGSIAVLTVMAFAFIGAHEYARALQAAAYIALLGAGIDTTARRIALARAAAAPGPNGERATPYGRRWRRTRRPRPYH